MIYENILETIGQTPIIKLKEGNNLGVELFVKTEMFNPTSSVKDRPAHFIISMAENRGLLTPGDTIIEASSGNMGISLAMIAATKGYKLIITTPESISSQKYKTIKAYGATIILTPAKDGMAGALYEAKKQKRKTKGFMLSQFENFDNSLSHHTTAQEIWSDTDGNLDGIFLGVGSGGSISGIGKFWKQRNEKTKIYAIEPEKSAILSEKKKNSTHKIFGIGIGFPSKILDTEIIDEFLSVTETEAYEMADKITKQDGIFIGPSSGAVISAMIKKITKQKPKEGRFLALLPDSGVKYLCPNMNVL